MRLVVVSNRLPVVFDQKDEGWSVRPASGGLVTALSHILRQRGGVWIGWPGVADRQTTDLEKALSDFGHESGYELVPVPLSENDLHNFYYGFSNEIIWPLFHDLQSRCNFVPEYWASYRSVIAKFADVCRSSVREDDLVWVQDYHLMGLGRQLRQRGLGQPLGFFLHTPFPPPDIFAKLPWRSDVLESLLWYDIVGLQTPRDRDNFFDCVRKLLPGVRIRRWNGVHAIEQQGRLTVVGVFPIGIDYNVFAREAAAREISERARALREQLPDRQIILGVDRLDYTKGIPYRLRAFGLALQRYPELHRKVTLLQVVVPSREAVPEYQDLKSEIERQVAQINGEFTQPPWVPIHYVFQSLDFRDLLTYYRAADVGCVTPLKDGMNLIAKEYCACQIEGDGVLILSEFAGAAVQLRQAILVNPYDLERVAAELHRAVHLPTPRRRVAMRHLRSNIRRQNVHWWAETFLGVWRHGRRHGKFDASQGVYAWMT